MSGGAFTYSASGSFSPQTVAWDSSATGAACWQLREAASRLRQARDALMAAPSLRVPGAAADPALMRIAASLAYCEPEWDARQAALADAAVRLDELADVTMIAGRAYETASSMVQTAIEQIAEHAAWLIGRAIGVGVGVALTSTTLALLQVGAVLLPIAALIAVRKPEIVASVVAELSTTTSGANSLVDRVANIAAAAAARLGAALPPNVGEAFATPEVTAALRIMVEAAPSLVAGVLGIPKESLAALEGSLGEDEVLALLTAGGAAAAGASAGAAPVRPIVRARQPGTPAPVTNPGDAMRVIQTMEDQVTVHELRMPDGSRRFQVFINGTQSAGLSDETGLDGLANVENGSGALFPDAGSAGAVAQALRDLGVGPNDQVDLIGYSQGGLAAVNVASTGEFRVSSVTAIGAPVDGVDLPADIPVLPVAMEGDHVPAVLGNGDRAGVAGEVWKQVNGRGGPTATPDTVLLEPAADIGSGFFARHDSNEYLATLPGAAEQSTVVRRFTEQMAGELEGASGVATTSVQLRRGE